MQPLVGQTLTSASEGNTHEETIGHVVLRVFNVGKVLYVDFARISVLPSASCLT